MESTSCWSVPCPAEMNDGQLHETCVREYRDDYSRNWNVDTRPYAGIEQMLDELAARKIKMAVLSNKPDEFTQLCVRHYFGRWSFGAVIGASAAFKHKPDPAPALEIARRLNMRPHEFLYVGDTATDMQTAKNAGMAPVGALWGFRTREELEDAGARFLIARPDELLAHAKPGPSGPEPDARPRP